MLDGRSNVIALTDVNGRVVDAYAYDAWGQTVGAYETVAQPFRYGGYWYDAALGWYWVSVRPYDPQLKRWLQPDPSSQDGVRTYVYADNDPIDETDPSGLSGGTPACGLASNSPNCYGSTRSAHPTGPCEVFLFGYFCERNREARIAQIGKSGVPIVTVIVYSAQGSPASKSVYKANARLGYGKNDTGAWGENQAIVRLEEIGYKQIGVKGYTGPDALLELQGQPVRSGIYTKYVFLESKASLKLGDKGLKGKPSLRQKSYSYYEESIDEIVSDPETAADVRALFRAGKVQVLLANTNGEGLTVFSEIELEGAGATYEER